MTRERHTEPNENDTTLDDPLLDRQGLIKSAAGVLLGVSLGSSLGSVDRAFAGVQTAEAPPPRPTGVVRAANTDPAIRSLDPTSVGMNTESSVVGNLYDALYDLGRTPRTSGKLVPSLATGYESSNDSREWMFRLRGNVMFHDGEAFDSTAVRKTIEYYQKAPGFWKTLLPPKFTTLDDSDPRVIRFILPSPFPDFLRNQMWIRMISPKLIAQGESAVKENAAGTGPFKLARWDKGRSVTMEGFDDYWGRGPHIEQLIYVFLPDQSARLNAFRAGQLDVYHQLPFQLVRQFESNSRFQVKFPTASWTSLNLWFETQKPPTDDPRVRRAIAYGLDYEAILRSVVFGHGVVPSSVLPEGVYGHTPATPRLHYNPSRARALLRQAGHAGGFKLAIAALPQSPYPELAQAAAGNLKDIGISARVDILDNAVFNQDEARTGAKAKHHLFSTAQGWFTGGPILISAGFFAWTDYKGLSASLVPALNATPDGSKRLRILKRIQDDYSRNVPVIHVVNESLADAMRSNIRGFVPNSTYLPYFADAYYQS